MRTIVLLLLPIFAISQNSITVNITRDSLNLLQNPKLRIYANGNLVSNISFSGQSYVYNYPNYNTTYTFEPYFDSIPTSLVTTADWKQIADESMYLDAPNGQKGVHLNTATKYISADLNNTRKISAGYAYRVLTKKYFQTNTNVVPGNLNYIVYSTHNRNGSTTQYGSYANSANDFNIMFNTANSNTVVHSSGSASPSTLFYFTNYQTLVANGVPVPNNGDFYGVKVTGTFVPKETGVYYFGVDGDDGVDLSINGNVITSFYGPHGFGGYRIGSIYMVAGTQYTIMARMQEFGGGDGLAVAWKRPSQGSYSIQPDEIMATSTSYYGPKVEWFLKSQLDNTNPSSWLGINSSNLFPISVSSGAYTLNLKYIVKGNTALSSTQ
jgi:hypothetical protein